MISRLHKPVATAAILILAARGAVAAGPMDPPATNLPAGHPSLGAMSTATTNPAANGSLLVSLTAGTAGAAAPANEAVTVELYHRNTPLKKYDFTCDPHGKLVIRNLPLMPPVQALISVKHAGLLQQILTPELNGAAPDQAVEMKLFETTEKEPAWKVAMQHMILQWDSAKPAIHVVEMISTSVDSDRAWLGTPVADGRVTLSIPLPPEAQDVEIAEGFDEQSSRISQGRLVTGNALFPGRTEFRLSYNVPVQHGSATLAIASPAAVENLIVFAPADGASIAATGFGDPQNVDMGEGKVRMFRAQNLPAGATEVLSISNLLSPVTPAAVSSSENSLSPRNVAIGGAFLLALIGAGMMLIKKPQPKRT